MTQSIAYKIIGDAQVLSVTNVAHNPVYVPPVNQSETMQFAGFTNIGTSPVFMQYSPGTTVPPADDFPTDGSVPELNFLSFVLPPLMNYPIVLAVPPNGFTLAAVSNSATPSLVFLTPMGSI